MARILLERGWAASRCGALGAERLADWRTFELDNVSFRVGDIDGGAFSLGSVAHFDRAHLDAAFLEVAANTGFVEWLHPQTEVIEISPLLGRGGAAGSAQFAIDGHQIDDGSARTQLDKADRVLPSFHGATQHAAIEMKHAFEVDNAQNEVINLADVDHGGRDEAGEVRLPGGQAAGA